MAARGFIELLRLAERGRARVRGGLSDDVSRWSGVGFVLAGQHYVAPLGEIAEVLKLPEYTAVPGAYHWLKGLANVRGRLLPLADLALFAGLPPRLPDLHRKVMVIDQPQLFSGLIVDEVLGIQHFSKGGYSSGQSNGQQEQALAVGIAPYIQGRFERESQVWHVFLPSRLAADSRYLNAAAQ